MGFGSSVLKKIKPSSATAVVKKVVPVAATVATTVAAKVINKVTSDTTKKNEGHNHSSPFMIQFSNELKKIENVNLDDEIDKKILFYLRGLGEVLFFSGKAEDTEILSLGGTYHRGGWIYLGRSSPLAMTYHDVDLILTVKAIIKNLIKNKKLSTALTQKAPPSSFINVIKTIINFDKNDSKIGKINYFEHYNEEEKEIFKKRFAELIWNKFFIIDWEPIDGWIYDKKKTKRNLTIQIRDLIFDEKVKNSAKFLFNDYAGEYSQKVPERIKDIRGHLIIVRTAISKVSDDNIDVADAVNIIIMYILFEFNSLGKYYNEVIKYKTVDEIQLIKDKSIDKVKSIFINEEDLKTIPVIYTTFIPATVNVVHVPEVRSSLPVLPVVKSVTYSQADVKPVTYSQADVKPVTYSHAVDVKPVNYVHPENLSNLHNNYNIKKLSNQHKINIVNNAHEFSLSILKKYANFSESNLSFKSISKSLSEKDSFTLIFCLLLFNVTRNKENISFSFFIFTAEFIKTMANSLSLYDKNAPESVIFNSFLKGLNDISTYLLFINNDKSYFPQDIEYFHQTFFNQDIIKESEIPEQKIKVNLIQLMKHLRKVGDSKVMIEIFDLKGSKGKGKKLENLTIQEFKNLVGLGNSIGPGFGDFYNSLINNFSIATLDVYYLINYNKTYIEMKNMHNAYSSI